MGSSPLAGVMDGQKWHQIYDCVLNCGTNHSPKEFAEGLLKNIRPLCDFDAALIYSYDGNGNVQDQYLMNIDEHWSSIYLDYYSEVEDGRFSYHRRLVGNDANASYHIRDWGKEQSNEFIPNVIRPRGLRYSLGFSLNDLNGIQRLTIALDRTRSQPFSSSEQYNISLVLPLLSNLYQNFYFQRTSPGGNEGAKRSMMETAGLTDRESQVANMICQGVSPANISRVLCISLSTTYKHIAHIYEKMHISSKQELMARLLG
jgi:DNA-binding CsgD family transcriptional regulator